MPWLETDVRDQRMQFVLAATRRGANIAATCRVFGIAEKTGHKWLHRYRAAGSVVALHDRSRRPSRSPTRTTAAVTARVVALRREFGWAGDKLTALLAAEGQTVAARTIDRIIAREGLTHRPAVATAAPGRFERPAPNDLWQMDAKGYYPLRPRGQCHPLCVIDDHSRFAVGVFALATLERASVQPALIACFERYGVPQAMLMDRGTPWWSASNAAGLSGFSVFLLQQGIHLLHGRVRHPQTQGKVERLHRTLGERLRQWGVPTDLASFRDALAAFQREYNEIRPHESLAQTPPARRFQPSGRPYQPQPPRWEYPSGARVAVVDQNGMVTLDGHRWFISEALRGEAVRCVALGRTILIQYRHMWVRELDCATDRSTALLQAGDAEGVLEDHTTDLPMS
jgi:transposase InsO family protein